MRRAAHLYRGVLLMSAVMVVCSQVEVTASG